MMNDMPGGAGGQGSFNDPMGGDKPITVSSVLNEFRGIKDKFKNEDEDDCECYCFICHPCISHMIRLMNKRLWLIFWSENPNTPVIGQSSLTGCSEILLVVGLEVDNGVGPPI